MYICSYGCKAQLGLLKDYLDAMLLLFQQDKPEDNVIVTGVTTKVRDIIAFAFNVVGIKLKFEGEGEEKKGIIDSVDEAKYNFTTDQATRNSQIESLNTIIVVDLRYFPIHGNRILNRRSNKM